MTGHPDKVSKRALFQGGLWNNLDFAARVAIALVISPVLIQELGTARYGAWALVESVIVYFTLLDFGIGASVLRYVARFDELRDPHQIDRVFSTTLTLFGGMALICIALSAAGALVWRGPASVSADVGLEARALLALMGVSVGTNLIVGVFSAGLLGLAKFATKVKVDLTCAIITAVFSVAAVRLEWGLIGLGAVACLMSVIRGVATFLAVRAYLPDLHVSLSKVDMATFKMIRGYSLLAFVAMLADKISFRSDAIVIGAFLAPDFITYFAIGGKLTGYARRAVSALGRTLTPAITALDARGEEARIRRAFVFGTRYLLWLAVLIQSGLVVLGPDFLRLWLPLNPELPAASYPSLVVLAVPLSFDAAKVVAVRIMYGRGDLRAFTVLMVAQAVANLGLSLLLVGGHGILGVAIGTAVPSIITSGVIVVVMCRKLEVSVLYYLGRGMAVPIAAAMVPVGVWMGLQMMVPIEGWIAFLEVSVAGSLAYALFGIWFEFGSLRVISQWARALRDSVTRQQGQ